MQLYFSYVVLLEVGICDFNSRRSQISGATLSLIFLCTFLANYVHLPCFVKTTVFLE